MVHTDQKTKWNIDHHIFSDVKLANNSHRSQVVVYNLNVQHNIEVRPSTNIFHSKKFTSNTTQT